MLTKYQSSNLKERERLEDLESDGRISYYILNKEDVRL
jgi:hypothetical protein